MQILGGVGAGASPPTEAPVNLAAISSPTSVVISFTAGYDGGLAITNYEYSISTDGATYESWVGLSPSDPTSPITIGGLLDSQNYTVKLRAVNNLGVGPESNPLDFSTPPLAPTSLSTIPTNDSVSISFTQTLTGASAISNYFYSVETSPSGLFDTYTAVNPEDATSPIVVSGLSDTTDYFVKLKAYNGTNYSDASEMVSFTTLTPYTVEYLVVAGGGATAGGGGGMVVGTSTIYNLTDYSISVGGGGSSGSKGTNSTWHNVTGLGGGGGSSPNGGSGAGASGVAQQTSPPGGTGYGSNGGAFSSGEDYNVGHSGFGGGGGAGGNGPNGVTHQGANGGSGRNSTITGSTVTYAGGGAGNSHCNGCGTGTCIGGSGGGGNGSRYSFGNQQCSTDGAANTGGGGGARCGGGYSCGTSNGGSGVIIIAYPSSYGPFASIDPGLVYTLNTSSRAGYHVYRFTGGTGNVRF